MNSVAVNPTTVKQSPVRNELGQFAGKPTTPTTQVNQAKVNADVTHWLWLYSHGFDNVQPNEIFAAA